MVAFNQKTDFIIAPWLRKAIHRELKPGECILGHTAWLNLGLLAMDKCTLFGNRFTVLGALHKTGTGFDNCIFVSDKNVANMIKYGKTHLKPNQISIIFVKDKPGYFPKEVATNIENAIWNVSVVPRNGLGSNILATLKDINTIFMLTVALCLTLSALLTWAIFSAIINERKKEIGVMRAIGAKNKHIIRAFVLEVFLLGAIGSALGAGAGTYLAVYFSRIFILFRDMPAGLTTPDRIGIALVGIAVGTGVCLLGALAPIIKIKKMEPLTAIKES
ncbi:MAG: ABC transporter permease [Nitrospiraceae bacterium]|nr:ABC transporter permease [Nitrospiraceae bacterium]